MPRRPPTPPPPAEPTAAEVRAWESANARGHRAAAEHFRAAGYPGLTEDRVREIYRAGGKAGASPEGKAGPGKGSRARARDGAGTRATAEAPSESRASQGHAEAAAMEATALVHVPEPEHPPGTLEWYEASLREITQRLRLMPVKDGAAYAALTRQSNLTAEKIAELRREREAASATHLSPEGRLQRLRDQLATWPILTLRLAVEEYLGRTKLQLYDPRDGGRILVVDGPTRQPDETLTLVEDDEDADDEAL